MNAKELESIINEIGMVADLFYMQKDNEAYNRLNDTLLHISITIDEIFALKSNTKNIGIDETKVNQILGEAMSAMENKDSVLLADILKYDLIEQFEKILNVYK